MPNLEIKAEPNEALAEHLKIRQETLDVVRAQMQAGFSQLGKELAELRKTRATTQSAGSDTSDITVSRYKSKTDTGQGADTVNVSVNRSLPSTPIVVESGASVVFNSSSNVTVDLGTHVDLHNHQETNRASNTSVAIGDSVMETVGRIIGGLFKL